MRAFFPQGQRKLSVRTECSNKVGVRKAGFRSNADWAISLKKLLDIVYHFQAIFKKCLTCIVVKKKPMNCYV